MWNHLERAEVYKTHSERQRGRETGRKGEGGNSEGRRMRSGDTGFLAAEDAQRRMENNMTRQKLMN